MAVIRKALSDTRDQLGGVSGIIMLILGLLGGVGLHGLLFGQEAMLSEWPPVLSALAAYGLLCIFFLIFNFAAAPFRIENDNNAELRSDLRDAHSAIGALKTAVAELNSEAPKIVLEVASLIYGGESESIPGKVVIACQVRAKNIGRAASILESWKIQLIPPSGIPINAPITHLSGEISLSMMNGQAISFNSGEIIYEKTKEPITPGDLEVSFLLGFLPKDAFDSGLSGFFVRVTCIDVMGTQCSVEQAMTGGHVNMSYIPQINATYKVTADDADNG